MCTTATQKKIKLFHTTHTASRWYFQLLAQQETENEANVKMTDAVNAIVEIYIKIMSVDCCKYMSLLFMDI